MIIEVMIENLQQIIINFCIDSILEIMIFFFLTALISLIGYKEEWGEIQEVWGIISIASSIVLVILLILYLVPLTIPSLKNMF